MVSGWVGDVTLLECLPCESKALFDPSVNWVRRRCLQSQLLGGGDRRVRSPLSYRANTMKGKICPLDKN